MEKTRSGTSNADSSVEASAASPPTRLYAAPAFAEYYKMKLDDLRQMCADRAVPTESHMQTKAHFIDALILADVLAQTAADHVPQARLLHEKLMEEVRLIKIILHEHKLCLAPALGNGSCLQFSILYQTGRIAPGYHDNCAWGPACACYEACVTSRKMIFKYVSENYAKDPQIQQLLAAREGFDPNKHTLDDYCNLMNSTHVCSDALEVYVLACIHCKDIWIIQAGKDAPFLFYDKPMFPDDDKLYVHYTLGGMHYNAVVTLQHFRRNPFRANMVPDNYGFKLNYITDFSAEPADGGGTSSAVPGCAQSVV